MRLASIAFAVASAVFWMLASTIQYYFVQPVYVAPREVTAWVVAFIGILPMAIYAVICLFFSHWLQRKLMRLTKSDLEKRDH